MSIIIYYYFYLFTNLKDITVAKLALFGKY